MGANAQVAFGGGGSAPASTAHVRRGTGEVQCIRRCKRAHAHAEPHADESVHSHSPRAQHGLSPRPHLRGAGVSSFAAARAAANGAVVALLKAKPLKSQLPATAGNTTRTAPVTDPWVPVNRGMSRGVSVYRAKPAVEARQGWFRRRGDVQLRVHFFRCGRDFGF